MTIHAVLRTQRPHLTRTVLSVLAATVLLIIAATEISAQGSAGAAAPPPAQAAGTVRPGDEIHVQIWREPELSGDFQVDESGVVVFPKIGPMKVTSEDPAALNERLRRAYSVYLVNPSIQTQVRRRINVLGSVKNPGLYPVDATITVADAISIAGGITPAGRTDVVEVRRTGETVYARLTGRELIGQTPLQSGDQLFVPQRGWISRNPGVVIAALGLMSTIVWRYAR
jgi:polysaccharide export outer membrane protein